MDSLQVNLISESSSSSHQGDNPDHYPGLQVIMLKKIIFTRPFID